MERLSRVETRLDALVGLKAKRGSRSGPKRCATRVIYTYLLMYTWAGKLVPNEELDIHFVSHPIPRPFSGAVGNILWLYCSLSISGWLTFSEWPITFTGVFIWSPTASPCLSLPTKTKIASAIRKFRLFATNLIVPRAQSCWNTRNQ